MVNHINITKQCNITVAAGQSAREHSRGHQLTCKCPKMTLMGRVITFFTFRGGMVYVYVDTEGGEEEIDGLVSVAVDGEGSTRCYGRGSRRRFWWREKVNFYFTQNAPSAEVLLKPRADGIKTEL